MRLVILCLALTGFLFGATAQAELPAPLRTLLINADAHQDDAGFRETADLVAMTADCGRADVLDALDSDLPHRLALFADWSPRETVRAAAAVTPESVPAPAPAPALAPATAMAEADAEPQTRPGRFASLVQPETWSGRVSLGLQVESGNTDLSDYAFALHLDRELDGGWGLNSKFEYFYTESDNAVTRDNWLIDARADRQLVDRWGYYVGGSYERDNLGSYESSAFLTAGGTFEVIDSEAMNWDLRAGAGARYRQPNDPLVMEETDAVLELGSVFAWALTETTDFTAETTGFIGGGSRLEQRFAVTTSIAGAWALETGLRIRHEFEEQVGSEQTDTRLDIALVREF